MATKNEKKPTPNSSITEVTNSKIVCEQTNYFGETLREIRIEKGISQSAAANQLGITQSQWSYYEIGKCKPTLDIMISMAKILDASPFEILGRSIEKTKYFSDSSKLSIKDFDSIVQQGPFK